MNRITQQLGYLYLLSMFALLMMSIGIKNSGAAAKEDGLLFEHGIVLIPEPQQASFTSEKSIIGSSIKINSTIDIDPFIKNLLEMDITLTDKKKGIRQIDLQLLSPEEFGLGDKALAEGYKITIDNKKIVIQANTNAGLFYGAQTLLQLIAPDGSIPLGEIADWPDMNWRAVHFDTKHHQDRLEYYQDIIPKLASYKINAIVFEIEDKLAYTKHPEIAAQGAFKKQELRELADLAHKYYIDFIPLVQGLGHVRYILKHPEYAHLRETPESTWQICPLKNDSFKLLFDLYDEAIEATGTKKYFHIGGDESYDLAQGPQCRKKAEKIGKAGIYLIWLNKVAKHLEEKGLQVIIWDDMVLKFGQENLKMLPKNVVYMRWNYDTDRVKKTALFDAGFRCMVASATQCTTPVFPDYENRLQNIAYFTPSGRDKGAQGELCTAWDDSGLNMETFWLGFIASAEYAWSGDKPGLDEYRAKFIRRFYGPHAKDILTVYNILSQAGNFWNDSRGKNFWRRNRMNHPIQFPPLPDESLYFNNEWAEQITSQSSSFAMSIEAQRLARLYQTAGNIILENLDRDIKNKMNLRVLLSVVRLFKLNTDLLQVRYDLAKEFSAASDFANAGQFSHALEKLEEAQKILKYLIDEKKQTQDYLEKAWQENQYPRDRSDLGSPMPYYVDRDRLHFAELSANYDYMFWVEKTNHLSAYLTRLQNLSKIYKNNTKLSGTETWQNFKAEND